MKNTKKPIYISQWRALSAAVLPSIAKTVVLLSSAISYLSPTCFLNTVRSELLSHVCKDYIWYLCFYWPLGKSEIYDNKLCILYTQALFTTICIRIKMVICDKQGPFCSMSLPRSNTEYLPTATTSFSLLFTLRNCFLPSKTKTNPIGRIFLISTHFYFDLQS